jgi:hypothetical protein
LPAVSQRREDHLQPANTFAKESALWT